MAEIGEFFGLLILFFYGLAMLNYVFKFLHAHFKAQLKQNEKFYKIYMQLLKYFMTYHKYFGGITILLILTHFLIMFSQYGISITGGLAAGTMLLQVGLGVYGQIKKVKNKLWLLIHRSIGVLLMVMILIHIV